MARKAFRTKITTTGPFFTHDPAKTLQENVHAMMLGMRKAGQKDIRGQLRFAQGERQPIKELGDHVSDHVFGELRKSPTGPPFSVHFLVRNRGFTRAQAISMNAAGSYLEGTLHAFRKTRGRIMRSREINQAELLKGLK